jgi:hypothetical protein
MKQIKMRIALSREYNLKLINANDPKIGSEIFASILSKEMNINKYELKKMQSPEEDIHFKDCILPDVKFKTKGFQELLKYLKQQVLNPDQTKGFFF